MQAAEVKNTFSSASFNTTSGGYCADQTSSGYTLFAAVSDCSEGKSTGKIVGIVVGSVIGGAIILAGLIYVARNVIHLKCIDIFFRPSGKYLDSTYSLMKTADSES